MPMTNNMFDAGCPLTDKQKLKVVLCGEGCGWYDSKWNPEYEKFRNGDDAYRLQNNGGRWPDLCLPICMNCDKNATGYSGWSGFSGYSAKPTMVRKFKNFYRKIITRLLDEKR